MGTYNIGRTITSLVLDGSKYPYVDLSVGTSAMTGDFTITMYVKPDVELNGCIFEYLSNTTRSNITRVKVCLEGGSLNAVRTIGSSSHESVAFTSGLTVGQWSFMSIGVRYTQGTFDINVESNHNIVGPGFQTYKTLETPGKLRIGGTFDGSEAKFAGTFACVGIYNILVTIADKQSTKNLCVTTTGWNFYQYSGKTLYSLVQSFILSQL